MLSQHLCVALIAVAALATPLFGEEEKPAPPATVDPKPSATVEDRLRELEQTLAARDAEINTLKQRLDELETKQAQPAQPQPNVEFQLPNGQRFGMHFGPDAMLEMERRMQEFMRDFDNDGFFGGRPNFNLGPRDWGRMPPPVRHPGDRARLGVQVDDVTPRLARDYDLPAAEGAFVVHVAPDTPAAKAGLMAGDTIVALDGNAIKSAHDLKQVVRSASQGEHKLDLIRGGKKLQITVELPGEPEPQAQTANRRDLQEERGGWIREPNAAGGTERLNVSLTVSDLTLTDALAGDLKLTDEQKASMQTVLTKHHGRLNAAYAQLASQRGAVQASQDLNALIKAHVEQAEAELNGVLNAEQLAAWKTWREQHRSVQFSQQWSHQRTLGAHDATNTQF